MHNDPIITDPNITDPNILIPGYSDFQSGLADPQNDDEKSRRIQELEHRIRCMSTGIVFAMVSALDAKDPYTAGHSERVADYSVSIGKKCGFSLEKQRVLYSAALLHDVGKIGIPSTILNKTSGLTEEEFEQIRNHPQKGADILHSIYGIPEITTAALGHHERYDGTGYPNRLTGEDNPEIARLVAVADAYDAMASKRAYRNVLPQAVIRSEIEKGIGTQFDPRFASAMLEIIDEDAQFQLHA